MIRNSRLLHRLIPIAVRFRISITPDLEQAHIIRFRLQVPRKVASLERRLLITFIVVECHLAFRVLYDRATDKLFELVDRRTVANLDGRSELGARKLDFRRRHFT